MYINPRNKLLQHFDRLQSVRDGKPAPPVNIEIDLSNRCSLGCEWCHFAYTHTRGPLAGKQDKPEGAILGGDLMDTRLAISIINQLREAGVKSVTWTGGGEPTLHPHFDYIIDMCRIDQGIYTHGGHIDHKRAQLLKSRMEWVYISLDESNPIAYKQHKGVDRFNAVLRNVSNLVEAEGKAIIGVGFLLTRENWRRGEDAIKLGASLGVDYIQFRPTIHTDPANPGIKTEKTNWMADAVEWLRGIEGTPGIEVDLSRFEMYHGWAGHGYSVCHWANLATVITPNGKVWTCVNKREFAGEELGDLTREPFMSIWERKPQTVPVNGNCRVMCRGHVANTALDEMLREQPHKNFI